MLQTPASPGPGRDDDPGRVPPWPDWMDDPAYLAARDQPNLALFRRWVLG